MTALETHKNHFPVRKVFAFVLTSVRALPFPGKNWCVNRGQKFFRAITGDRAGDSQHKRYNRNMKQPDQPQNTNHVGPIDIEISVEFLYNAQGQPVAYRTVAKVNEHIELACDRCHNKQPHGRKRLPYDPTTFCDDCKQHYASILKFTEE